MLESPDDPLAAIVLIRRGPQRFPFSFVPMHIAADRSQQLHDPAEQEGQVPIETLRP